MEVAGKTVIVTGSGRGIGRATALGFARAGANVVVCDLNEKNIRESAADIERCGVKSLGVKVDVTQPDEVRILVSRTLEAFGRIDVLFNNAGIIDTVGGSWEKDVDAWWHVLAVNLRGTMLCCHAVLPHMIQKKEGVIINMGGGGAFNPMPGTSAYACSKTAILRFTDTLAQEMDRVGSPVIVFAMDPGFNRTMMTEGLAAARNIDTWLPHVNKMFDAGEGNKPEDCVKTTIELIAAAEPWMCGRLYFAGDDVAKLVAQKQRIADEDRRTLRFRDL